MKNIFKTLAAVAMIALAASCSKDAAEAPAVNGDATVTFSVELPGIVSRAEAAINDGSKATELYYAVYEAGTVGKTDGQFLFQDKQAINLSTTVNLELVADQTYDIVFWAQAANTHQPNLANKTIAMNYAAAVAGADDKRDAFIGFVDNLEIKGSANETVYLKRPFAQLNVALSQGQLAAAEKAGFELETVTVKTATHTGFSIAEGIGDATGSLQAVEFKAAEFAAFNPKQLPGTTYDWVSFNYVLPALPTDVVDVEIIFTDENGKTIEVPAFTNVPIERNHRTNIVGDLLTDPAKFEVIINPIFDEEPGNIVKAWDGKTTKEPAKDANNNYIIAEPSELAWLADQVNGVSRAAGNTFAGQTFKMTADLDLREHPWMPIGNSTTNFQGTFDGQGYVIRNLVVNMPGKSNAGLFGMTTNGEIKNLVIEDAKITGRLNVGVVAGTPYTSKYTNITLQGLIQVEGMAYVGGIGGKNCYANWDQITINAEEGSYVKANSVENGTAYRTYVGGVIGFMGEGGHKVSNVTSNINVEGSTCDVGGIAGIAHYGNIFENITCTGNVTNLVADEVDVLEMGGIAGVWHNQDGQTVTITNATFEGELINTVGVENYYYGGLVGAPYSKTGKGKLVLNGQEYVAVMEQATLADKVNEPGATINVPAGTYTFPKNFAEGVTLVCAEGTVFEGTSSLNINGATVEGATFSAESGRTVTGTINGTFKNCTFEGPYALRYCYAGETTVFEDCVFDGGVYGVHFDGGDNPVILRRCELSGFNAFGSAIPELTLENCVFKSTGKSGYNGANLWGKTIATGCTFLFDGAASTEWIGLNGAVDHVLSFTNCTVTDGQKDLNIFDYFANWEDNAGYKVTINGVEYTLVEDGLTEANGETIVTNAAALHSAIEKATANATIVLADGLYADTKSFDIKKKTGLTIKAQNARGAKINSLVYITDSSVKLEGLELSNTEGVLTVPAQTGDLVDQKVNGMNPVVGVYTGSTVELTGCKINMDGNVTYGFSSYASTNATFTECEFECYKKRPIATNGDVTKVMNCTFNNQYHYSVRIFENAEAKQTVVYTNNVITGSNDKGEFEGINISKKGGSATILGDFTIKGNPTTLKYRHHKLVDMSAACTYDTDIAGFAFEREQ